MTTGAFALCAKRLMKLTHGGVEGEVIEEFKKSLGIINLSADDDDAATATFSPLLLWASCHPESWLRFANKS